MRATEGFKGVDEGDFRGFVHDSDISALDGSVLDNLKSRPAPTLDHDSYDHEPTMEHSAEPAPSPRR